MAGTEYRLNLDIGAMVKLEFDGADLPISGKFVGMEDPQYLIFRLPSGRALHEHLYEGHRVTVKCIGSGKVFGFQTEVLTYLYKNRLVIGFFRYPGEVEIYELRRHERVECFIPAVLTLEGDGLTGYVLDISPGGCRFGFASEKKGEGRLPRLEEIVTIAFSLLGVEGQKEIRCLVKAVYEKSHPKSIGLKFEGLDETLSELLAGYVRGVRAYLEGWD